MSLNADPDDPGAGASIPLLDPTRLAQRPPAAQAAAAAAGPVSSARRTQKLAVFGLSAVGACLMYAIRVGPSIAIDGDSGMAEE